MISSCHESSDPIPETRFKYNKANVANYLQIIDTLDRYDYVPNFRNALKYEEMADFDSSLWGFSRDVSKYLRDSATYHTARASFFNQDREMLYWLLDFRNDTMATGLSIFQIQPNGDTIYKLKRSEALWVPYQSPLLSKIPRCLWHSNNHLQAISLIHAYLNGPDRSMDCIDCSNKPKCTDRAYSFTEAFLTFYRKATIETLRHRWQFWKDFQRLFR